MYRLPAESEIQVKRMTIETTRLMIRTASQEEMLKIGILIQVMDIEEDKFQN